MIRIKRTLLSVADKTDIVEFARQLADWGITILSTGGTAKLLSQHAIDVTNVSDYTEFPEIMGGRVKTLHPKIHGGLLGRHGIDEPTMAEHDIEPIDLLVVNLYPFEATVQQADATLADAIENIDIGGPAMLRSAAKNYARVAVVVDTTDYQDIISELTEHELSLSEASRFRLAQKAFAHTANYDATISNYLGGLSTAGDSIDYPETFSIQFKKRQELRYGENPHQTAAFYAQPDPPSGTLAQAKQWQGKPLSYNNIVDTDAALECVLPYSQAACVIVKHANPCAVALGEDILQAYEKAYQADPTSAFGGIIAFNLPLDAATAQAIIEQQFVEVIVAPCVQQEALTVLANKENIRVLEVGTRSEAIQQLTMKRVSAGLLVQDQDQGFIERSDIKIVSQCSPTMQQLEDMAFAWQVVKYVKSNAIVYAKDKQTIGIGAGQMSRVYSARIATMKATEQKLDIAGAVMASDAFLPFRDSVDTAAEIGVTAIIQPGGSIRDDEVIAAADEMNISMAFTGMRHFLH